MRISQCKIMIAFLTAGCVLSGCQQAPKHQVVDGIDKAVNQEEQQISEIPGDAAMVDIHAISVDPIKTALQGDSGTITVDAQVDVPTISSFYTGSLTFSDFTKEELLNNFFGERANDSVYNEDESMYIVPIDSSLPVNSKSDTEENVEKKLGYGNGELTYINLPIYMKYHDAAETDKNELDSSAFSIEEATQQLREILSGIGINDITIFNVDVFSTEQKEILYSISFTPIYNDVPFVNPLTISSVLSSQIPQARAEISKEGLAFLSGSILLQADQPEEMEKVVAIEQILNTIPDMIGSKISQNDNSTITSIALRYIVKSSRLTLVWDFGFKEGQSDLIFNAETGQIEDIS